MKLLLDEHFDRELGRQLREERGHDVQAVNGDPRLQALADPALLAYAAGEGRVLVTENVVDFMRLHQHMLASGEHHAGLILTNPRRFPRDKRALGHLLRALDAYLRELTVGADLTNDVHWL